MINMKQTLKQNQGSICRRCLNEMYHVSLMPANCRYRPYMDICDRCGGLHHLVTGLRLTGWLKTLFA